MVGYLDREAKNMLSDDTGFTQNKLVILSVDTPGRQDTKGREISGYSRLLQRSRAGCIGAQNVKLFGCRPLGFTQK